MNARGLAMIGSMGNGQNRVTTDYFKPVHLEQYPDLHTKFWNAAKLCSACKVEVNSDNTEKLMSAIEDIQSIFWQTKGRTDVSWYRAN